MNHYILLYLFCIAIVSASPKRYSVLLKGSEYSIEEGAVDESVASGFYEDTRFTNGWASLQITTFGHAGRFENSEQMYAAGFLEGWLTAPLIWDSWQNAQYLMHNHTLQLLLWDWLLENHKWMVNMTHVHKGDPYWQLIGLNLNRFDGMVEGYHNRFQAKHPLEYEVFLTLASGADVMDVIMQWLPIDWLSMNKHDAWIEMLKRSRCSAFIKIDKNDVFLAHNSWAGYTNLIKVFKRLTLDIDHPILRSKTIAYSSYPGYPHSADDFLVTNTGLAITETTIQVFRSELYKLLTPASLLNWVRTMVATMSSTDPLHWIQVYELYNSGTNNNQWMILDFNKLKEYQNLGALSSGTFYILEQIPGKVKYDDMSSWLSDEGYWSSYNIPFFTEIYEDSEMKERFGDEYSYENCSRAKIFARDQSNAIDKNSVKRLIQYNDYLNDPLSLGDPTFTISARGDLYVDDPQVNGGIDSKIISLSNIDSMDIDLICGPTHQQQPFFNFSKFSDVPHHGIPLIWKFDWIVSSSSMSELENFFPSFMIIIALFCGLFILSFLLYAIYKKYFRKKKDVSEQSVYYEKLGDSSVN